MRLQVASLKQRLFPAEWRARCLEMLDHADSVFGDEICWRTLKEQVRRGVLLTKGDKVAKFATNDLDAANLVLDLIARMSERQVTFGENHIYRGVLSFTGKSYRSIAEIALHEMHENEALDYDELEERLEQIDEAVKAAG
ncbi:MAG: hypothetical protein V4444_00125 [Pseudomonadota bacterium]